MSWINACDFCGGPANWSVDAHGDIWFYCKNECVEFRQQELFPEDAEPIWNNPEEDGVRPGVRGDAADTTSASENEIYVREADFLLPWD